MEPQLVMNISLSAAVACFLALAVSSPSLSSSRSQSGVDIGKLKITIDTAGVAKTIHKEILPEQAHDETDQTDTLNGEPRRLRIKFDNDKLAWDGDYSQRHLLVYPLKRYASLYHGAP